MWNRIWTFRDQRGHVGVQGMRFFVVSLASLLREPRCCSSSLSTRRRRASSSARRSRSSSSRRSTSSATSSGRSGGIRNSVRPVRRRLFFAVVLLALAAAARCVRGGRDDDSAGGARLRRARPAHPDAVRPAAARQPAAHEARGAPHLRAGPESRRLADAVPGQGPDVRRDVRQRGPTVDDQDLVGSRRRDRGGHRLRPDRRGDRGVDRPASRVGDGARLTRRVRRHRDQRPVGLGRFLPRFPARPRRLEAAVLAPQPRSALPPVADGVALVLQPRQRLRRGAALLSVPRLGRGARDLDRDAQPRHARCAALAGLGADRRDDLPRRLQRRAQRRALERHRCRLLRRDRGRADRPRPGAVGELPAGDDQAATAPEDLLEDRHGDADPDERRAASARTRSATRTARPRTRRTSPAISSPAGAGSGTTSRRRT